MLVPTRDSSALALAPENQPNLEFMVVCNDASIFRPVAAAIQQVSGRLNCAPSTAGAWDYLSRRKVDGIVVDMGMPGALEMINRLRVASCNRSSVVFACMGSSTEMQFAIRAGANFVFHHPLLSEKIAHIFASAAPTMLAEKRRSFRYPLMVPVLLKMRDREVESTMSNLSEGGMAIWSLYYHTPGSEVQFTFELPFGGSIRGQGEVAWTNTEGLAGVKFHFLPDQASAHLNGWVTRRDPSTKI
jgi:CheY-like chemotaxis protein